MTAAHPHYLDRHPDDLLTVEEVASILRRSKNTVQVDATRRPEILPAITKVGRSVLFRVGDVLDFIHSHRLPIPAPVRSRVRQQLRFENQCSLK